MAKNYDYLFKILMIGDSGVGKTCVLYRLTEETFNPNFISTIGIDFKMKNLEIESKKIRLQIWDTAGQERFRTITQAYYRGSMGIIVLFDVTNRQSFENVKFWLHSVEENASSDVEIFIFGNKCDLDSSRAVTMEEGAKLATEYNALYSEVSAKSGLNVVESFLKLALKIKIKMDKKLEKDTQAKDPTTVNLQQKNPPDTGKCSC